MSHRLIVLPDDTAKPILDAINGAKTALNIRMFLFTDETLLSAVIAAKQRGVKVRVMLNPARRTGEAENEASRQALTDAGIEVRDSNPKFDLTHQKSMVVDHALGFGVERLVIEGLERLMQGRTVIMIAHRLSTLRNADKIIVLKDGIVVEEGTNDELVALGGVYAELHRIQYDTPPAPAVASA